jgi:hypothetical protein
LPLVFKDVIACPSLFPLSAKETAPTRPVGVAQVDITPDYPIRLSGYLARKTECEGVTQRLWAKALAIGDQLAQQVDMLRLLNSNKSLQYAVQASESAYTGDEATILAQIDRLDQQWRAAVAAGNDATRSSSRA